MWISLYQLLINIIYHLRNIMYHMHVFVFEHICCF
jgi:hypothetical protein